MRVVAGVAKGRPLKAPAGRVTRPTSDRVREAIFSILTSLGSLEGAVVIDLFAGSGALGIEAISRGAASATFVDRDPAALAAIEANLAVLGDRAGRAAVVRSDVLRWLERSHRAAGVEIVLADPPYEFDDWAGLLTRLSDRVGVVVAESAAELETFPGWETVKVKRYGGTVVTVMQPHAQSETRVTDSRVRQEGES
jgi:16S rRNA (guanine966-N2)-methyltransferase